MIRLICHSLHLNFMQLDFDFEDPNLDLHQISFVNGRGHHEWTEAQILRIFAGFISKKSTCNFTDLSVQPIRMFVAKFVRLNPYHDILTLKKIVPIDHNDN